jgi:hypothetical protein
VRKSSLINPDVERLVSVAIRRVGETYGYGFTSHYALRLALSGDGDDRHPGDIEGFMTSTGRFVERREAADVALQAGQIHSAMQRELLSSDVHW